MITEFHYVMNSTLWTQRPFTAKKTPGNRRFAWAVVQKKGWIVARFATDGTNDEQDAELAILLCEAKFKEE